MVIYGKGVKKPTQIIVYQHILSEPLNWEYQDDSYLQYTELSLYRPITSYQ